MTVSARALLVVVVTGPWTLVTAQEMTGWGTDLQTRPAYPHVIVAPEYPKEAAAQGRTATVDVIGRITEGGMMEQPTYRSSSDDPAFEREVASVVTMWLFRAAITDECKPKAGEAQVRVWFEIGEQGPKVSISVPRRGRGLETGEMPRKAPEGSPIVKSKEKIVYPRKAIQANIQGARVIAYQKVNAAGDVVDVHFQRNGTDRSFFDASDDALRRWKFDMSKVVMPERGYICTEVPINFHLR